MRKEAEENNDALLAKLQEIENQNINLQRQVGALRGSPSPQPAGASELDVFGDGTSELAGQPAAQTPGALDVQGLVTNAIEQYDQKQRQTQAASAQLHVAQRQSAAAALAEFPELGDGGTQAAQIFQQLWEGSPLQAHPDGPYHVALQVRGIIADEVAHGQTPAEVEARKIQASVITPKPAATDTPSMDGKALQKQYDELLKRRRNGSTSVDDYMMARALQIKMRGLQQRQK
jgi:hypothetical protein